jgi:hypothetical protein
MVNCEWSMGFCQIRFLYYIPGTPRAWKYSPLPGAHSLIQIIQPHSQVFYHAAMGAEEGDGNTDQDQPDKEHDQQAGIMYCFKPANRAFRHYYDNI